MRLKVTTSILAFGSLLSACDAPNDNFTEQEWAQIQKLEPLKGAPPRSPYNLRDQDEDVAKLGQMLFFDKEVAEAITVAGPSGAVGEVKKVACVNCHDTPYYSDSHLTTPGTMASNGMLASIPHGRSFSASNTGQLVNLHWNEWALWAGRFDSLVEHGTGVWGTSATVMAQARFLYAKYKDEWNVVFPDNQLDPRLGLPTTDPANIFPATGNPPDTLPADALENINKMRSNLGRLFDTYPRMLMSPGSPFQRYVRDRDYSALTGAQKRGLKLFIGKAACNDCHNGPTLADNRFHNIGAPNVTMVPGNPNAVAPNRGRATAVAANVTSLNTFDANPNAVIFSGAGRYSDDQQKGYERLDALRNQDRDHCLCRKTDAVADAAACTAAVMSSPVQMALASDNNIPCLVMDDAGYCTCRQTEAVADITKCTDVVMSSTVQQVLRTNTKVACLKYDDTLEGMFRTPTLLNVAETGPYFHSGSVQTLEEVIQFYNQGGGITGFAGTKSPQVRPLGLSEDEVQDLAEFLRSLTGKTPAQQAAEKRQAAIDNDEDPNQVWDWTKNTSKPPLTGAGGSAPTTGAAGAGAKGGAGGGSRRAPAVLPAAPPRRRGRPGGVGGSARPPRLRGFSPRRGRPNQRPGRPSRKALVLPRQDGGLSRFPPGLGPRPSYNRALGNVYCEATCRGGPDRDWCSREPSDFPDGDGGAGRGRSGRPGERRGHRGAQRRGPARGGGARPQGDHHRRPQSRVRRPRRRGHHRRPLRQRGLVGPLSQPSFRWCG